MVIGDEEFCIWMFLPLRGREGMGIASIGKQTAEQLKSYMERHFIDYNKTTRDLITELEIS